MLYVIPYVLLSLLQIIVIPSKLLPFQIFVILNSSCTLPYPKGENYWQAEQAILGSILKNSKTHLFASCINIIALSYRFFSFDTLDRSMRSLLTSFTPDFKILIWFSWSIYSIVPLATALWTSKSYVSCNNKIPFRAPWLDTFQDFLFA